jgi:catecholate siderophore receptor
MGEKPTGQNRWDIREALPAKLPESSRIKSAPRAPVAQAVASVASVMLSTAAFGQQSANEGALPTIEVQGDTGGYQTTNSSLTRLPTPLRDTPQSVTVVPQQIIQEQKATNVTDALRNVAGITFRAGEGGAQGDTPFIRGFDARNDIFRDGVRDPGWYTRDTFSIESIEVLKGPSSFLFGRGSTGGVINLTTKTPKDTNYVEGEVTATTGPGVRATIDANSKINENVSARIQVMGQNYDIPGRNEVEENRWGVAPSVKFRVSDRTNVTFSYIYQDDNNVPDRGIPFLPATFGFPRLPVPVDRATWYGILSHPLPDRERVSAHIGTAKIEHLLSDQVKVTNITRYVDVDRFNRVTLPNNFNPPVGGLATYAYRPGRQQVEVTNTLLANQTDLSAKFATGPFFHQLTAGVDLVREEREQTPYGYVANSAGATSVFYPNPYRTPGTFNPAGIPTVSDGTTIGAYVADQVKITQYLELLGGARFDNFRASSGSTTILERTDNLWSWRVGAVLHPLPNTSVYVMHGTSFNPSAEFLTLSAANLNLGPEKNETSEVGAKVDLLGGRLSLTGAVFRTDKTNARIPDPTNTAVNILEGLTRIEGFELGAIGKLTDRWQIFVTYTHLRSEIVETTVAAQLGNELINTPNDAFSLWTTYDITPALTVGGGAFYVGEMWANVTNESLVPSFWRFDAMAAYKLSQQATLQLNVYNITDEYYFAQTYNNWVVPGPGRYASLSLRVRW